jgi:hypothetical protein
MFPQIPGSENGLIIVSGFLAVFRVERPQETKCLNTDERDGCCKK